MIETVPNFTESDYGSEKLKKNYMFSSTIEPDIADDVTIAMNNA